jgi:large subunit ribosomal protein L3
VNTLIGKKIGMTQIFGESGTLTPVSVIQVGPCPIVQVKTVEKDGYNAVQIGFGDIRETLVSSPRKGHFDKAKVAPQRLLREVRVDDTSEYKVGEAVDVKIFEGVEKVHVSGRSKGRGFAGTVRRHNFSKGDVTHGSHNIREPGSVGMCATPARIFKGKKLPGRMGGVRETTKNLKVVQIDPDNNLLYVRGSVPGASNGFVLIRKA